MDTKSKKAPSSVAWWSSSHKELAAVLSTELHKGLSPEDAEKRLLKHGKNTFEREKQRTLLDLFIDQIKSPLAIVLIVAGIITFLLEHYVDTIVIGLAVLINVFIGVLQERRAGKAFETLTASQSRQAVVFRGGEKFVIPVENIVPGDLIVLEQGMYVPADARILEEKEFFVNESTLTGEWTEVKKNPTGLLEEGKLFIEQPNMVWMGTLVTGGNANAIVVETGASTQLGSIAESLGKNKDETTPLEQNIKQLAHFLAYVILGAVFLVFALGLFRGVPFSEMLLISIAIAVGMMPEGLPVAVTVVLAIGMERILSRGGLVKKLSAAETLGSTTVILTDKTGTLTQADMRVRDIQTYASLSLKKNPKSSAKWESAHKDERDVVEMAILTTDAFIEGGKAGVEEWIVRGRPIERAILYAGLDTGLDQKKLLEKSPRVDFLPFDSMNRFSASLHKIGDKKYRLYFLGSPELLFTVSQSVYVGGSEHNMTKDIQHAFKYRSEQSAKEGMRLIALAYKDVSYSELPSEKKEISDLPKDLVFAGIIGLHDPLRGDVTESIRVAKEAGARVVMVTGDYSGTAERIAAEVGIARKGEKAIQGVEIEKLSDKELLTLLEKANIFARVLPHQKLRLARLFRSKGEIVAMTGDGVNDAPALKEADIGIALGSGTEVAKEAAGLVLLNNDFSVIIAAIEEGRRILDNLKKVIIFLLSTSFSEVFVVGAALLVGAPLPLLPAQILWANIVGEGFMNFAFAFEPKEEGIMKRNPRDSSMQNLLTSKVRKMLIIIALTTGLFLTLLYFALSHYSYSIEKVRSMVFVALSISSILFAFSLKDFHRPLWKINIFSNQYLILAFSISLLVLSLAIFAPPVMKLVSVVPLSGKELLLVFSFGLVNLLVIEIAKYIIFRKETIRESK